MRSITWRNFWIKFWIKTVISKKWWLIYKLLQSIIVRKGKRSTQLFCLSLMMQRRYCSYIAFTLSVWPSVWGWLAVENEWLISRSEHNRFQKSKVNWVSQSEMIESGKPWSLKILLIKESTAIAAVGKHLKGMKWAI